MQLAIDVYYYEKKAKVVGIVFENWKDEKPIKIISTIVKEVNDYESGNFYKRELPCIKELVKEIKLESIRLIIVDSFVYLDDNNKLGLGGYLYEFLSRKIPVIGVAKNYFYGNKKNVKLIFRGKSKKPLYISSIGINLDLASDCIIKMHGNYRFPTLLKILDQETKNI